MRSAGSGYPSRHEGGAALVAQPSVIADALAACAALGVAHVQLDVQPATSATFATVLKGLARFRSGG